MFMNKLAQKDYYKVAGLIKSGNELSVHSVISGILPGSIYVNDVNTPSAALILTSECNYLAGTTSDTKFNLAVRDTEEIDFWDTLTPDTAGWEEMIPEVHKNRFIRKYTRRHYVLNNDDFICYQVILPDGYFLEKAIPDDLREKSYINSSRLLEDIAKWGSDQKYLKYGGIHYIRHENVIVSWSMVDCYHDGRVEIGVHTDERYRRMGFGKATVSANINDCFIRGINLIGWNCVSINKGSIAIAEKLGFKLQTEYVSFSSYPPVENPTDLSEAEWNEWGEYYEKVSVYKPQLLMEQLYAYVRANNIHKTKETVQAIINAGKSAQYRYMLAEEDNFRRLLGNIRYLQSMGMCSNFADEEWTDFIEKTIAYLQCGY